MTSARRLNLSMIYLKNEKILSPRLIIYRVNGVLAGTFRERTTRSEGHPVECPRLRTHQSPLIRAAECFRCITIVLQDRIVAVFVPASSIRKRRRERFQKRKISRTVGFSQPKQNLRSGLLIAGEKDGDATSFQEMPDKTCCWMAQAFSEPWRNAASQRAPAPFSAMKDRRSVSSSYSHWFIHPRYLSRARGVSLHFAACLNALIARCFVASRDRDDIEQRRHGVRRTVGENGRIGPIREIIRRRIYLSTIEDSRLSDL